MIPEEQIPLMSESTAGAASRQERHDAAAAASAGSQEQPFKPENENLHATSSPSADRNNGNTNTSAGGSSAAAGKSSGGSGGDGSSFECNICLDLAQDPVVTLCGHLFCWPCLYEWLRMRTAFKDCPVCKAGVEEAKVIPLYGRGNLGAKDPRTKSVPGEEIPHRPQGQRPEPTPVHHPHAQGFNFVAGPAGPFATAHIGGFTLSAGFGLFPSLFGLQFQSFPAGEGPIHGVMGSQMPPPGPGQPSTPEQQQQTFLSRLLLLLGSFVIICLLFF